MALNGSFAIYYFVGPVTGNQETYMTQPALAGLTYIFTSPVETCGNCARQEKHSHLVSNTTRLTPMLLDCIKIGELRSLDAEDVKPYLIKNLKWRVVQVCYQLCATGLTLADLSAFESLGDQRDPRTVRGLQISLSSVTKDLVGDAPQQYDEYPEVIQEIIDNSS